MPARPDRRRTGTERPARRLAGVSVSLAAEPRGALDGKCRHALGVVSALPERALRLALGIEGLLERTIPRVVDRLLSAREPACRRGGQLCCQLLNDRAEF